MGLGIYIKGEVQKSLLSFKKKSVEASAIKEGITALSSGIFSEFLSFSMNEATLSVTLHPCEEPVYFEFSDNEVVCSAKTNSLGPGYHAYLVELIEKLGQKIGIHWHWNLEENEEYYQDETGYYESRDFHQLQTEMVRWLKALCRAYAEDQGDGGVLVSMPAGFPRMRKDFFALSPVGQWNREWFEKVASLEPEDLHWAGTEFFPWWNKPADALFYKQTGIALMNCDCTWHYPTEAEEKLFAQIDKCFEHARELEPTIELPEEDWSCIKDLLSGNETEIPDTKYGCRKHLMAFDLTDGWLIDLSGRMYYELDENSIVYYDHEVTVRSLAYTLSNRDMTDQEYADQFFKKNKEENSTLEELDSATELAGKAIISYVIEKGLDREYWMLQGVKVKDDRFLLSTICYPTEDSKQWAIDTWNSVRR